MVTEEIIPQAVQNAAYRSAVQSVMVQILGEREELSSQVVNAWWDRLLANDALKSGFFSHAEPIQTAAALLGRRIAALTDDQWSRYEGIMQSSMTNARREYEKPTGVGLNYGQIVDAVARNARAGVQNRKKIQGARMVAGVSGLSGKTPRTHLVQAATAYKSGKIKTKASAENPAEHKKRMAAKA